MPPSDCKNKTSWKKLWPEVFWIIYVVFPSVKKSLMWLKGLFFEWHLLDFIGRHLKPVEYYIKYIKRLYPWEGVWALICIPLWTFCFFFFSKENKEMTNDGQMLEMVNFVFVKPWLPSQFFGSTKLSKINNVDMTVVWLGHLLPQSPGLMWLIRLPKQVSPSSLTTRTLLLTLFTWSRGPSLNRRGPQSRVARSSAPC